VEQASFKSPGDAQGFDAETKEHLLKYRGPKSGADRMTNRPKDDDPMGLIRLAKVLTELDAPKPGTPKPDVPPATERERPSKPEAPIDQNVPETQ
jgi:hypothetical protein